MEDFILVMEDVIVIAIGWRLGDRGCEDVGMEVGEVMKASADSLLVRGW